MHITDLHGLYAVLVAPIRLASGVEADKRQVAPARHLLVMCTAVINLAGAAGEEGEEGAAEEGGATRTRWTSPSSRSRTRGAAPAPGPVEAAAVAEVTWPLPPVAAAASAPPGASKASTRLPSGSLRASGRATLLAGAAGVAAAAAAAGVVVVGGARGTTVGSAGAMAAAEAEVAAGVAVVSVVTTKKRSPRTTTARRIPTGRRSCCRTTRRSLHLADRLPLPPGGLVVSDVWLTRATEDLVFQELHPHAFLEHGGVSICSLFWRGVGLSLGEGLAYSVTIIWPPSASTSTSDWCMCSDSLLFSQVVFPPPLSVSKAPHTARITCF